ncbi:MAG TPA: YceI family protein [Trebonia sp.]|jgi:polyisoprenoid-binding protein YceI|nr:YceI family protein [Trebonia sp.]
MASLEQLTPSALQTLLQDGNLAGSWTLDPARSEVQLKTRHTWGLLPLQGAFAQVAGNGTVTAAGDVSGVLNVAATSVDTKNPRRDKHLRSADFFDVDNHKDITFSANGASPAGDGVRITGTLTVRGVTRPATLDAKVSSGDGEVQLDGELAVNRADFGLTWNFIGIAAMDSTIVVRAVFTRQ